MKIKFWLGMVQVAISLGGNCYMLELPMWVFLWLELLGWEMPGSELFGSEFSGSELPKWESLCWEFPKMDGVFPS